MGKQLLSSQSQCCACWPAVTLDGAEPSSMNLVLPAFPTMTSQSLLQKKIRRQNLCGFYLRLKPAVPVQHETSMRYPYYSYLARHKATETLLQTADVHCHFESRLYFRGVYLNALILHFNGPTSSVFWLCEVLTLERWTPPPKKKKKKTIKKKPPEQKT